MNPRRTRTKAVECCGESNCYLCFGEGEYPITVYVSCDHGVEEREVDEDCYDLGCEEFLVEAPQLRSLREVEIESEAA